MTIPWMENHKLFREQLDIGFDHQKIVFEYILNYGIDAKLEPLTVRDDPDGSVAAKKLFEKQVAGYGNSKDIVLLPRRKGKKPWIVETKSRSHEFDFEYGDGSVTPFRFGFPDAIIETVSGYELKNPKPKLYVNISQVNHAMIATWGDRPDNWRKKWNTDEVRGGLSEVKYFCDIEHFRPLYYFLELFKRSQE